MERTIDEFGAASGGAPCADSPSAAATGPPVAQPLVGVVRNPRSHRNRGHEAESLDDSAAIAVTPNSRDELTRELAQFAERGVGLIVVDGGDGTMRDVLSRGAAIFGEHWPRLMVLPKGKTNALTVDLGMPRQMGVREALTAAASARIVERRPILVDQPDFPDRRAMGFILGAGVFTTAIAAGQVAHKYGAFNSLAVGVTIAAGALQALAGIGRTAWRKLAPMRICTGEGNEEVPHSRHGAPGCRYLAGISSLENFPVGLRPFGPVAAGGLRYVLLDAPLRRIILMLPLLCAGWHRPSLSRLGLHRGAAECITLELGEGFILDGEVFPPGRYRLRLGPPLQFLVP